MAKKLIALIMALVLVFAMTACSTPSNPAPSTEPTQQGDTEPSDAPTQAPEDNDNGEVVTLKYYEIGNQDTNVREAVQNAINEYIEPKIGANIEFQIVGWGDWDSKALVALQSGEEIDLFFTADWKHYMRSVTQNLFTALNDDNGENGNLLELYGQDILSSLNPAFITGTQINGVNYAVPTNKELCVPQGYIYNVDAAAEVGMDPAAIKTLEDLEPYLAKYKELHPEQYPYITDGRNVHEPWVEGFASITGNLLTIKMNPDENGVYDDTLYSIWETPEQTAFANTMYKYNQAGYLHPDSSLSTYDAANNGEFAAGKFLVYAAPLKGENIKAQEMKIAAGNPALNLGEIYIQNKIVCTTHTGGSMIAIPTTSENPVTAMKFLNMMHSDVDLLDMMLFGVPETMWTFADDGRVQVIDSAWYGAHGGAWTMGNTAIQDVTTIEDPEKNQKLQDYSADAKMHPTLGFRYVCPNELESQWAAVNNVQDAMNRTMLTGGVDPSTELPKYISDLKAAGLDDIKADVEKQYAEWKASK